MNSKYYPFCIFFIFIFIYALGSFTRIPFADCVGFVLNTEKGELETVFSSTSHPLYINTAILIRKITGVDAILTNRIVVIFSAALTVFFVYKTVSLLTDKTWIPTVSAFVFGLSFSFWRNAEIVEVYTQNAALIMIFLYFLVLSYQCEKKRNTAIITAAFFLGLCMWLHIQNIFFIPSFLLFLYYFRQNRKTVILSFLVFLLVFGAVFLVNYFQGYPLNSPFNSNEDIGWVRNSLNKSFGQYLKDFLVSLIYLVYNFNVFVILGIIGVFELYKFNKKIFYPLFIAAVLHYGFATFYAVSDNYVFFIPSYLIFIIGVGMGLRKYQDLTWVKKWSPLVLLTPFFYLFSFLMISSLPQSKDFKEKKAYKGGLKYYLLPWMNNNVGIVEFTAEKRTAPEPMSWMTISAEEYIKLKISQGYSLEEIKKF